MPQLKLTADILSAALIGFEVQRIAVDAKIAEIRRMLGPSDTAKPKRAVSAAARRRMARAQRLRWKKIRQARA